MREGPTRADRTLRSVYRRLLRHYGPQRWWPARARFEVVVGAILTQNTSWANVEKAIVSLRVSGLLSYSRISRCSLGRLARRIRPAGSFNVKARRLRSFTEALRRRHGGSLTRLLSLRLAHARRELLLIHGVGPETADCILLYAGDRAAFVVDAYTRRILSRIGLMRADARSASYEDVRSFCMKNLPRSVKVYNECHALLVRLAKEHCRKSEPLCQTCPLYRRPCNGLS